LDSNIRLTQFVVLARPRRDRAAIDIPHVLRSPLVRKETVSCIWLLSSRRRGVLLRLYREVKCAFAGASLL